MKRFIREWCVGILCVVLIIVIIGGCGRLPAQTDDMRLTSEWETRLWIETYANKTGTVSYRTRHADAAIMEFRKRWRAPVQRPKRSDICDMIWMSSKPGGLYE